MSAAQDKWTQLVVAAGFVWMFAALAQPVHGHQAAPGAETAAASSSVWSGVYTDEQAARGEAAAGKLCVSCHGPDLTGGEAGPGLVGLEFLGNWSTLSVADLADRVQTTMPADSPGTMTPQQTSDVTAYVFKLNKMPSGTTELPTDPALLKKIMIEGQPAK